MAEPVIYLPSNISENPGGSTSNTIQLGFQFLWSQASYRIKSILDSMSTEVSAVFVTYPDERTARAISRSLIERRLAACSNIFAVSSIYRWKGEIEEAAEFASLLKIRSEDFQAVVEAVKKLHPYDVPCIVRYDVAEGSLDYLRWVIESTGLSPTAEPPR